LASDKWSRWLNEERWGDQHTPLEAALAAVRDRVLAFADLKPGSLVLDVGAGTGLLGLKAAQLVGPAGGAILVDLSHDSLLSAQEQALVGCEHFAVADALHCPLGDRSVDAVVMRSVLVYVPDRLSATREIARVLRPGGRFAAYEPINRRMEQIVDMIGFEDVREAYQEAIDKNTLTNFDENDLVSAFRHAGFTSVEIEMEESRFPVRGKEWAHGFRYGAPAGYNAFDTLLEAGISPKRAEEFLAHGERLLGDEWRVWSCPVAYLLAVR